MSFRGGRGVVRFGNRAIFVSFGRLAPAPEDVILTGRTQRGAGGRERGGTRLNLVLTLAFLGATVYTGWKILPPYFNNYQFQDAVASEARYALTGYPRKTEDDLREDIWKKAQELSIPLKKKDEIQIVLNQGNVTITADYAVPIDLLVYQFSLQFHPHANNYSI